MKQVRKWIFITVTCLVFSLISMNAYADYNILTGEEIEETEAEPDTIADHELINGSDGITYYYEDAVFEVGDIEITFDEIQIKRIANYGYSFIFAYSVKSLSTGSVTYKFNDTNDRIRLNNVEGLLGADMTKNHSSGFYSYDTITANDQTDQRFVAFSATSRIVDLDKGLDLSEIYSDDWIELDIEVWTEKESTLITFKINEPEEENTQLDAG